MVTKKNNKKRLPSFVKRLQSKPRGRKSLRRRVPRRKYMYPKIQDPEKRKDFALIINGPGFDPSPEDEKTFLKTIKKYPLLGKAGFRNISRTKLFKLMENKDKNKTNKIIKNVGIRDCKRFTKLGKKYSRTPLTKFQLKMKIKKCKKILKDL